jgi:hypothetical protein
MAVRSRVVDRAAGVLLLAGAFANFAGVIMFSIRGGPSEMAEELFPSWGSGAASLASSELSGACSWRPWCYRRVYPMFVVYVTLAFVSQATIGCALAMSELIPRWIGWATAIWNLAWLAILVLARPWDIYFPILHLVMPGFIGAALILRRGRESAQEADLADIQVG